MAGLAPTPDSKQAAFASLAAAAVARFSAETKTPIEYLKELKSALDTIPDEMKPAYLEARKRCPELVDRESAPLLFLQRERGNPWTAALRLIYYWKYRALIFGSKAFVPLLHSLDADDITALRSGHIVVLPPKRNGTVVICNDMTRLGSLQLSTRTQNRYLFFLLHMIANLPGAVLNGFECLFIMGDTAAAQTYFTNKSTLAIDFMTVASPLTMKQIYCCGGDESSTRLLVSYLGQWLSRSCVRLECDDALLQCLETHGFQKECLPPNVGGTWSYKTFYELVSQLGITAKNTSPDRNGVCKEDFGYESSASCASIGGNIEESIYDELVRALDRVQNNEDYIEAKNRGLIQMESSHHSFLLCSNSDPWTAAQRLVAYWKMRKSLFGNRVFLPLNLLDGNGALSARDVSVLKAGYASLLSPDVDSRLVVYFNSSRSQFIDQAVLERCHQRIWFYLLHRASEQTKAQTRGVVVLHQLSYKSAEIPLLVGLSTIMEQALPIRVKAVHVLFLAPLLSNYPAGDSYWNKLIPLALGRVDQGLRRRTDVHVADCRDEMLARLSALGLRDDCLPPSLTAQFNGGDVLAPDDSDRHTPITTPTTMPFMTQSSPAPCFVKRLKKKKRCRAITDETTTRKASQLSSKKAKTKHVSSFIEPEAFDECYSFKQKVLAQLEDAILMLPIEQTFSLLEARSCIPVLANDEAPPMRFLRFEQYNAWAAASRLAKYWDERKEFFGDRAFLPMNLTGKSILDVLFGLSD
jgi:hypothetical protein